MVASVTIAKILGLIYIIPLARLIKNEGMGIYSNAYALYILVLTLSTAGFPTAMGKLVSEKLALHEYADVEQLYRITVRIVSILGVVLFALTWFGAPVFSHLVAVKESAKAAAALNTSIRALAPALLVVPIMSALRGYLQGFQKLEPSAYSQALEQLVRVVAIVLGAYLVMHQGGTVASGAAAATFGAFIGAIAGLVLLAAAVIPLRRKFIARVRGKRPRLSSKSAIHALMRIALPVSLGAIVVPISGLVDSLTITNFLIFAGYSFSQATGAYGVFSREAMQLIQLPLAFAMAIGVSVLPAIAEAKALRNQAGIETTINGTMRSMLFLTLPVAACLFVLGRPVDQMIFHETTGAVIISSVSFMSIFSGMELISTYMLQGLDKMYRPVRNMFIGIFIKFLLNIALILPFHIVGAAIASTVGFFVSSTLNVLAVRKYGKVRFSALRIAAPLIGATLVLCIALCIGSYIGFHVIAPFTHSPDLIATVQVIVALVLGAVVYIFTALRLRAVSPSELARVPAIGSRLSRMAKRLQARRA